MSEDVFQLKRGTTAAVNAYLPAVGEPVYDITLKRFSIGDGVTLGGVVPSNTATADKLTTAKTIELSGAVTGAVSFDGSANVTISTSVGSPLQSSLDSKAPLASPAFTGTPSVPTPVADTNTTQAASTAFVVGQAGAAPPLVNGTVAVGTSLRYSRQDHVHPIDTTRAPLSSPSFTGIPLSTTPAVGTNTTQIATAAMVQAEIANKRAWTSYTPTITAVSGTFTSVSASGRYMVAFGICHIQVTITVTTKGTGVRPIFTLPMAALASSQGYPLLAREGVVNGKVGCARIITALTGAETVDYTGTGDLATADGAILYINGSYPVA